MTSKPAAALLCELSCSPVCLFCFVLAPDIPSFFVCVCSVLKAGLGQ